jgi:hypothetical protein
MCGHTRTGNFAQEYLLLPSVDQITFRDSADPKQYHIKEMLIGHITNADNSTVNVFLCMKKGHLFDFHAEGATAILP